MNVAYGDESFPSQGPIGQLGANVSDNCLLSFFQLIHKQNTPLQLDNQEQYIILLMF